MVWGAFSAAGTGELLHCEKSINALEYKKILLENKSIRLMFLPGQSPDLNPIENICSYIKHKLTGKHFSTTHQLFETINIE